MNRIAIEFEQGNFIKTRRGETSIVDGEELEAVWCQCYAVLKEEYDSPARAKVVKAINTHVSSTRSVGMNLARRFNAGGEADKLTRHAASRSDA